MDVLIVILANANRQPRTMVIISLHTVITSRAVDRSYGPVDMTFITIFLMREHVPLGKQVPMFETRLPRRNLK